MPEPIPEWAMERAMSLYERRGAGYAPPTADEVARALVEQMDRDAKIADEVAEELDSENGMDSESQVARGIAEEIRTSNRERVK